MKNLKNKAYHLLRWSEKYTKTDMVYLARGGFWVNMSMVAGSVFAFVLSLIYANYLEKNVFGIYQYAISIGSILGGLTLTGMNSAVTRAVSKGFDGAYKRSIVVQILWGLIPFSASILLGVYYFYNNNSTLALMVCIVGLLTPLINSLTTYSAVVSGKMDFRTGFFFAQISNLIFYPILGISVFYIKNPAILLTINLILNLISLLILNILTIKRYKLNSDEEPGTISYGKHLSLSNLPGILALQIDNLLVFHYLGAASLAIYVFATNIPERLNSVFRNISTIALPKFSSNEKLLSNKEKIVSNSLKLFFAAILGSTIYALLAPFVFSIFFPEYTESIFYSQIYSFVIAISTLVILPGASLVAIKSKKNIYIYGSISPIINTLFMFVGIVKGGVLGLLIGKAAANLINYLLIYFLLMFKVKS